jgi:hypothetical protein
LTGGAGGGSLGHWIDSLTELIPGRWGCSPDRPTSFQTPVASPSVCLFSLCPSPVARWPGRLCPRRVEHTSRRSEGLREMPNCQRAIVPTTL